MHLNERGRKTMRKHRHTAGKPAYDVRGVVKILIYAYMQGTDNDQLNPMLEEVEKTAGLGPVKKKLP